MADEARIALGPTDMHRLAGALDQIRAAFSMPYLVGSALRRRDPRDIDVRIMLDDEDPLLTDRARVKALNTAISVYLRHVTDLPVGFQFQSVTEGNAEPGPRSALFTTWWLEIDQRQREATIREAEAAALRKANDEIVAVLKAEDRRAEPDETRRSALKDALGVVRGLSEPWDLPIDEEPWDEDGEGSESHE